MSKIGSAASEEKLFENVFENVYKTHGRRTKSDHYSSGELKKFQRVFDLQNGHEILPSIIKIFQRVFDLQSGHEINGLSLPNITKGDNAKSKKGRVVIHVRDMSSGPVLHFCQVPLKYSIGYSSYRADEKSSSNKTKGDNSKSKKGRVVILVCNTFSAPVLHFYQVS